MSTSDLLSALYRHNSKQQSYATRRKLKKIYPKFVKKQNILDNDLDKTTKLQNMSHEDLKKILRRIKNHDTLPKEDLIYTLLRSEKHPKESNYEKYISNNTTDELKDKTNDIRTVLARLGDTVPKKDRDKIRKELYEIENKKIPTKTQKTRYYNYLIELENTLDKKDEYKYSDYNDLDYTGIRDIGNLFVNIDDNEYCKPQLVKSSFENNYEYYQIRGDKDKKDTIKQYIYKILPELEKLINERKNNYKNEQKVQIIMGVNFININDKENARIFYVRSDNEEIMLANDTSDIIKKLIESFLSNYQKEEQILRGGSNFIYDSVDILGIHFHNIKLKRDKSYKKCPEWISSKKAAVNPKNTKDNNNFSTQ